MIRIKKVTHIVGEEERYYWEGEEYIPSQGIGEPIQETWENNFEDLVDIDTVKIAPIEYQYKSKNKG